MYTSHKMHLARGVKSKLPLRNDIDLFLNAQPGMALKPSLDGCVHIKGRFRLSASSEGAPAVEDAFQLHIKIVRHYKEQLPLVYETAERVPTDGNHHVNPDGSLCLGAPIRLHKILGKNFSLTDFVELCVVPFLYSISLAEAGHQRFQFGELAHGVKGLIDDYFKLFGCSSREALKRYLHTLTLKKRLANKQRCPCNCGRKLVKCRTHKAMLEMRGTIPKRLLKETLAMI